MSNDRLVVAGAGFTLIEMSIVLVIVGLVVGGIIVGSELIEGARIRGVISAQQDFSTRWNVFKLKYKCIPGDCPHATRYFGQSGVCPGFTDTATCDGDGNGWVHWIGAPSESALVWNHFYRAGLSVYTVIPPAVMWQTYYVVAPHRRGSAAGWIVGGRMWGDPLFYAQHGASASNDNLGSSLNGVGLQSLRVDPSAGLDEALLAVEPSNVLHTIDSKMDDGVPAAGKFRASGGKQDAAGPILTCITGSGSDSSYDLSQVATTCRYIYSLQ